MIVPIVLCGGSGTRLWPLSRRDFAKQHVPVLGRGSPFQQTLRRLSDDPAFSRPVVLTGANGRFMTAEQASLAGVEAQLIVEPEARDTLPAIAAAIEWVARQAPESLVMILPSDHLIPDPEAFSATVQRAVSAAREGNLVTFGVRPTGPATAYGYIRPGGVLECGGCRVDAFIEKPDATRAAALIAEGCLWNSGMFFFAAEVAQAEIATHAPAVAAAAAAAVDEASRDLGAVRLGPSFADATKISFDYAVMERTGRAAVIEAGFGWSDIGDWREIWAQSPKDENGVATEGDVVVQDSQDSYIRSDGRLVCAIGMKGLAVVDTPDALLIAPLERSQDIKALVNDLAAQGRPEATIPARVHRPWGWYQTMDMGDRFRVKRIQVAPGRKLSLQKHHHRAEHWVVVRGTAEVTRDSETILLRENESVFLPLGCVHRLANPGKIPVEIIEVQTGAYLEEDDIVRFEDDFGRD